MGGRRGGKKSCRCRNGRLRSVGACVHSGTGGSKSTRSPIAGGLGVRASIHDCRRYAIAFPLSDADVAKNVEQEIRDLIDKNLDDADGPETIEVVALAGAPGRVLVEQSQHAQLLVVGNRGRGGVASAMLGSVGLHCVLHAQCPVLVIRP